MRAYLQLTRPANILTAVADILLGFAASGSVLAFWPGFADGWAVSNLPALGWLVLATVGLYGGGVTLNDVFDADLDRIERPERPIPSGRASLRGATLLGILLLVIGVSAAAQVSAGSALIAGTVAALAIIYDAYGKHQPFFGPLNMGLCRGGNLLLGMSVAPLTTFSFLLAVIPIIYIAGITLISRGEVHGDNKKELSLGMVCYLVTTGIVIGFIFGGNYPFWYSLPFLLLFIATIFPPLFRAFRAPLPANIGKAVKMGVLALIILDATLSVSFAGWIYGLGVLALLPLSRWLAKVFAVT